MDSQEDGFAPCSPKKMVTQAAQRRRTANEQAREERFHRDLAHPNAFAALVDDGVRHELSQGDNREESGQDSVAENRLVPLSRLDAAYSYCILWWKHLTRMATILCLLHDIALVLIEPVFCKTMQAAAV